MKLRSLLYVSADNQKFIQKAHLRGADAIILDLEDSVKTEHKIRARDNLQQSVDLCQQSGALVFVRINSEKSLAFSDAKAALLADAVGLYVPKANPKRLRRLHQFLKPLEQQNHLKELSIVALIENALGVINAPKIARQKRVIALTLGAEDFANSIGAEADPDVLRLPKQMVHLAAKSENLLSFGLFRSVVDYTALSEIEIAAKEAKRFGFDGASCVHPNGVAILNEAFQVTETERAWARAILKQAESKPNGAFEFNNKMVDAPVLEKARKILNR